MRPIMQGRGARAAIALAAAALLVATVSVVARRNAGAPTVLESESFVSGLGAAADSAIAGMRSLWGTASSAMAAAPNSPPSVGTGAVHFQNVNLALSSAGQAALLAQQVTLCSARSCRVEKRDTLGVSRRCMRA
jgi:hypothetical protein